MVNSLSSFAEFFTTLETHLMSKYSTIWRNLLICCGVFFLANLKFVFTMILLILFKKKFLWKKKILYTCTIMHNNRYRVTKLNLYICTPYCSTQYEQKISLWAHGLPKLRTSGQFGIAHQYKENEDIKDHNKVCIY